MFAYDSYRQARWYHSGRLKAIRVIVVHCTVSKEMGNGAEAVANYFATTDRKGSTHAVADNDSVVGCVRDQDTAYGAAGANSDGLHLELVGMPDQTLAQWLDAYSRAEFTQAARVLRYWSKTYRIPIDRFLTIKELRDGVTKGMTTHVDVSAAFPEVSTGHWDPGPSFPGGEFVKAIAPAQPPPAQEDDEMLAAWIMAVTDAYHGPHARTKNPRLPSRADLDAWALPCALDERNGNLAAAMGRFGVMCDALAGER